MQWPPISLSELVRLNPEQFRLVLHFVGMFTPNPAPDESYVVDSDDLALRSSFHEV